MLRVDDSRSARQPRFDEGTAGITGVAQRPEADAGHRVLAYEFVFHNSHSMPVGRARAWLDVAGRNVCSRPDAVIRDQA